jgi:hypothetical protein
MVILQMVYLTILKSDPIVKNDLKNAKDFVLLVTIHLSIGLILSFLLAIPGKKDNNSKGIYT